MFQFVAAQCRITRQGYCRLEMVQQRRSVSRVPERTGPKTMSGDACEKRGLLFELRALATLQMAHLSPFWAMTQCCESAY